MTLAVMALGRGPGAVSIMLFSGLAADAAVFEPQRLAFPGLSVPKWPVPRRDERLAEYCERWSRELPRPDVLGGASFGGIVALEMARHLKPRAVVLVGSVRDPKELPRRVRLFRPLAPLVWWLPVEVVQWLAAPLAGRTMRRLFPHVGGLAGQFCRAHPTVVRWSIREILTWPGSPAHDYPVYQIHGDRDHLLPARHLRPEELVVGGGHVISLTHGPAVNRFLRGVVEGNALET